MALSVIAGTSACGEEAAFIRFDLQTDYVPGLEFSEVQLRVDGQIYSHIVSDGEDYARGVPVVTIDNPPEVLDVEVSIHGDSGARLIGTVQRFVFTTSGPRTLRLGRVCEGVVCPQGDPANTACDNGVCVDPTCPAGDESCTGGGCSSDADCPTVASACGAVHCSDEGACLFVGECEAGLACLPTVGCVEVMTRPDVGPDDGGTDTSADVELDSSPTCEAGAPCDFGGPCELGAIDCTSGTPECRSAGPATAGIECRGSSGDTTCDPVERCDGTSLECPPDAFAPDGNVCDGGFCVGGACGSCQPGAACTPAGEPCSTGEIRCTGNTATCERTGFRGSSTVCRAANGVCDQAEVCSGSAPTCPADSFLGGETTCRGSAGPCDVAEVCSGSSAACPPDSLRPTTHVCRSASQACDVEETCTGASPSCPADAIRGAGFVCRSASGACGAAEQCNGSSKACPADVHQSGTTCRPAAGLCDVAETCSGASSACPADSLRPAGTVCRTAAGSCDRTDLCSGSSSACPNAFLSAGTSCGPDVCSDTGCSAVFGACQGTTDETCTPRVCNSGGTCVNGAPTTTTNVPCDTPNGETCLPHRNSCGNSELCEGDCVCWSGCCGPSPI